MGTNLPFQPRRHVSEEKDPFPPPQLVHAGIHRDPVQPGGEASVLAKRLCSAEHLHEHLLRHVLSGRVVALQKTQGDREDTALVSLEHATLRFGVAVSATL